MVVPIESYFSSFSLSFSLISRSPLSLFQSQNGVCSVFLIDLNLRFGFVIFLVLLDFSSFGLWLCEMCCLSLGLISSVLFFRPEITRLLQPA